MKKNKPIGKNKYERCIWGIIHNATFKILSALQLYKSGLQNESFFLAIIAQEELSKLLLIPIANEIGELNELFNNRKSGKSPYFNHRKKQKIAAEFSLHDRKGKDIEAIKQSCLYIGLNNDYPDFIKIQESELKEELTLAIVCFLDNIAKIISTPTLSEGLKKSLEGFYQNNLIIGAVKDLAPAIRKQVKQKIDQRDRELKKQDPAVIYYTLFFSNIFHVIEYYKEKYPKSYRSHLQKLYGLSIQEIGEYIKKCIEKKDA